MQEQHPIEGLMKTAMESIKEMVDVNTVVGDAVETPDGNVIIPISRVTVGFAAGGSDFAPGENGKGNAHNNYPFGGGSGAGVSVQPVGFLVVGKQEVRLIPVDGNVTVDRIIDNAPRLLQQLRDIFDGRKEKKRGEPSLVVEKESY
ncbi:MAG: hypothetical protein PWQ91_1108 [Eubacteriales bacterium]|nr:hypothetical protein [Eubacteriales bacterium]MDN5364047.1 hypothetical protein [Eubacteriales bacterium]